MAYMSRSKREDLLTTRPARASVHFSLICDHLSPHDTSFSITDAKDLTDTKLSAACSLHAASGSTSSSTSSVRRRRLMEITEETEEEERERKRQSVVNEEGRPSTGAGHEESGNNMPTDPPVKLDADLASAPEASNFSNTTEPPAFTGAPRPPSPTKSIDDGPRRMSSQSARPDLYSSHGLRVRLGPRPSAELGGRPRTSAGSATYRPVSSIPAGFKVSKGHKKDRSRDQDDFSAESPIMEETSQSEAPGAEGKQRDDEAARPHTSSGASQVAPPPSPFKLDFTAPPPTSGPQKSNTVSREKARLLKAMKLREKKMMASQAGSNSLCAENPSEPNSPAIPPADLELPVPENNTESHEAIAETNGHLESSLALSKADSGIDVSGDQGSAEIHIDSHPTSPMAVSDIGESTQASSISESTDETVLAVKDQAAVAMDGAVESCMSENEHDEEQASGMSGSNVESTASQEQETSTRDEDKSHDKDVEGAPEEGIVPDVVPNPADNASPVDGKDRASANVPEEPSSRPADIRIPISKFSTQGSPPANSTPPTSSQAIPAIVVPSDDVENRNTASSEKAVEGEEVGSEGNPSKSDSTLDPAQAGRGHQERDKRMSVASLSDDDRLMDELQSATVQEAQPITVSKSPLSPFFPSDAALKRASTVLDSNPSTPRIVRTVSSPAQGPLLAPADVPTGSVRSASSGAAFLQKLNQQQSASDLRPKAAGKIGSSISQRIKALEKLSGSTGGPEAAAPKERPSSTFFAVRKTTPSIREPSRSPSVADRANSLTRHSPSPPGSNESSPEASKMPRRDRTGSMVSRLSVFEGGSLPRGRPESIQVTARIVRDPGHPTPKAFEPKADPGDYSPLDLKQSQLVVDVQKAGPNSAAIFTSGLSEQESVPEKKPSLLQRRFSKGRKSESHDRNIEVAKEEDSEDGVGRPRRRSSMTIVKDFIKDRRDSILGSAKSPSTDNLGLNISTAQLNIASPASIASSRSPSRPPSTHQTSSFTHRLSISSRRSSMEQARSTPTPNGLGNAFPSLSTDMVTEVEAKGKLGDKKSGSGSGNTTPGSNPTSPTTGKNGGSRASRFMKRLSSSLGTAKKSVTPSISPTVAEEDVAEVAAASQAGTGAMNTPSIVAYLGDVNVQFPDNLLWKRRAMCLDSQGFLILSAVQGTAVPPTVLVKQQVGVIKRYHMSDFKTPYTPEIEVQELPNSVVLDFVDGSGLQVACEDRAGQMNVLNGELL